MIALAYLAAASIGLYFLADAALNAVERRLGHRLAHREAVFFALLLGGGLVIVYLVQAFVE